MKIKKTTLLLIIILILISSAIVIYLSRDNAKLIPSTPNVTREQPLVQGESIGTDEEYSKIKALAEDQNVVKAWDYVVENYAQNNASSSAGHDYAHYVGKLIFEKNGLTGMNICTPILAFGCYHGLLDVAFRKGLSDLLPAQIACEKLGPRGSGPTTSCTHGIGHGVASYFKSKDLNNALKTCDLLPEGSPQYCYDGVFMEFSRDALDGFYKKDDPLYPCNAIDAKYTFACGRNLPSVALHRLDKSYEEVAKSCQKSPNRNLRTSCYVALGFQAVYAAESDPLKISSICESIDDKEFEYQCKSAAAGELVFQNMPNWQVNSTQICESITVTNQRQLCTDHVTQIQRNYGR